MVPPTRKMVEGRLPIRPFRKCKCGQFCVCVWVHCPCWTGILFRMYLHFEPSVSRISSGHTVTRVKYLLKIKMMKLFPLFLMKLCRLLAFSQPAWNPGTFSRVLKYTKLLIALQKANSDIRLHDDLIHFYKKKKFMLCLGKCHF